MFQRRRAELIVIGLVAVIGPLGDRRELIHAVRAKRLRTDINALARIEADDPFDVRAIGSIMSDEDLGLILVIDG